jgi:hypothetical protein
MYIRSVCFIVWGVALHYDQASLVTDPVCMEVVSVKWNVFGQGSDLHNSS